MRSNVELFSDVPSSQSSHSEFEAAWVSWAQAEQRAGRLRQRSSVDVYEHMWVAWSAWCISQDVALDQIASDDLDRFLNSRGGPDDISARHAWRFLRLVDRVLASRARARGVAPNPAATQLLEKRPDYRFANAADKDPLPVYLPASEAKRLVTFLASVRPRRTAAAYAWQEVRNRAAVGLMLGAGLTPGEVRALHVSDAVFEGGKDNVPWKLRVRGHAGSPARETPLAPWAGQLLGYWMVVRSGQHLAGEMLLPSTRTGKPWGKVSQYDATKEVLLAAGIDDVNGGSYKLRHTFVLRQLRRGRTPDEIARWLGVTDPAVMARYQRVLTAPVELV